jgi:hypothetical protein
MFCPYVRPHSCCFDPLTDLCLVFYSPGTLRFSTACCAAASPTTYRSRCPPTRITVIWMHKIFAKSPICLSDGRGNRPTDAFRGTDSFRGRFPTGRSGIVSSPTARMKDGLMWGVSSRSFPLRQGRLGRRKRFWRRVSPHVLWNTSAYGAGAGPNEVGGWI